MDEEAEPDVSRRSNTDQKGTDLVKVNQPVNNTNGLLLLVKEESLGNVESSNAAMNSLINQSEESRHGAPDK